MASIATLEQEILIWLQNKESYATGAQSAAAFMDAYHNYAQEAMDLSGDQLLAAPGKAAGVASLSAALSTPASATPPTAALAFAQAIQNFWLAATFEIAIPAPGLSNEISSIVTTPTALASVGPLTGVFTDLSPAATDQQKAGQMAAAIHPELATLLVTITGVSNAFPFPIITIQGPVT